MNKKVSIIIPAYNAEKYISYTIDSVIRQTYQDIEIIVVNDGSTDNTKTIVLEYSKKDTRIKLINQENKGLSAARNKGITEAEGEYVCIFDSDDIMIPEKIATQKKILDDIPECEIVYSGLYYFLDGTKIIYKDYIPDTTNLYQALIERGNFINPNTVLFRKEVFKKYGMFDEMLLSSEDWDYWLRLARQDAVFYFLPIPLTLYRIRETGMSGNRVVIYSSGLVTLEKQVSFIKNTTQLKILTKAIKNKKLQLFLAYAKGQDWSNAKKNMSITLPYLVLFFIYRFLPITWGERFFTTARNLRFKKRFNRVTDSGMEAILP